MSILFLILKWTGIVLLILLGFLLLLLLAVLFVPVKYKVEAGYDSETAFRGKGKASWLFHVITATFWWEEKLEKRIRIFGVPLMDSTRKKETKKKHKKDKTKKEAKKTKVTKTKATKKAIERKKTKESQAAQKITEEPGKESFPPEPEIRLASKEKDAKSEPLRRSKESFKPQRETLDHGEEEPSFRDVSSGSKKESFFAKIINRIREIMDAVRSFAGSATDRAVHIKERITFLMDLFERKDFQRAWALCKDLLYGLWKRIRPRKMGGRFHFGFEDPATTGEILAVAGITYPLWEGYFAVEPAFEQEVLEGSFFAKGRIRVFYLVKMGLILFFNKDIRRLIHIWKKEEAKHAGSESV